MSAAPNSPDVPRSIRRSSDFDTAHRRLEMLRDSFVDGEPSNPGVAAFLTGALQDMEKRFAAEAGR
ncbi:hypothetical protein [Antarcticirhabdus aurantiaca]|uniref:hypothetical protein n=1 Tax=Antarcticirhabdus aurantiaca TaxID=2606717 RepID=UPI00131E9E1D|nr:hypothetical protein [Antarcticirhabdus aurantiaca]